METYHLDTSVVMRLLVQEPSAQYIRAAVFLEEKLVAGASVFVSDLALAEAYFAMQSFYQVPKAKALELLLRFIRIPGINSSSHALAILSQPNLASAKPGFADRLIHGTARATGQTLVTFEKAAKNLAATVVLEG
jgi:predicted nucleic-acid-binding protein